MYIYIYMSIFSLKNLSHYALAIALVMLAVFFGDRIKAMFDTQKSDEYQLIRKYLLNDSPLYGYNRPKLWVHTKYEYNARVWQSFMSRSSTDLNQPYIHMTVRSIINHCGNDFNVCLIDDNSFKQLIPGWTTEIFAAPEPFQHHIRELAFAELLYIYGGLVVPNSFVCLKNLMPFYKEGLAKNRPFICENINRYSNSMSSTKRPMFVPDVTFMGASKRCKEIRAYAEFLRKCNENPHFTAEPDILGYTSKWISQQIAANKFELISGLCIGTKDRDGRPILLEDLMEEKELAICPKQTYGIYIPADELLKRLKYQWFAVLSMEDLVNSSPILTKYMLMSLTPTMMVVDEIESTSEIRTVVAI